MQGFAELTQVAVRELSGRDPFLKNLIESVGPCRLLPKSRCSPYQALVESVAYQQLNGRAAETILNRFRKLFPGAAFPAPERVVEASDELLRSAGLSRSKTAAIKDIAAKTLTGVVPDRRTIQRLDDAAIQERLLVVRGVGPWTVHMLLIFTLGRPDVLPATDYGVRQGFQRTFQRRELPQPAEILEHGERWRPYRTFASWYLWRALELPAA